MLKYTSMSSRVAAFSACVAVVGLLLSPASPVLAAGLRDEAVSYRVTGYEKQQQGNYPEAVTWYQKSAALDPTYPTPHNDLGVVYEQQGRLKDAEAEYQNALTLNPAYLEAHANLAMLCERMGEKEKAAYHWLKRYQLGDPADPWTSRAEERLVAFGVLRESPGLGIRRYARRHIIEDTLQTYDKTTEEFHAITEDRGEWP